MEAIEAKEVKLYVYYPNHVGIQDTQTHLSTTPPHHWSMQNSPYRCIAVIRGEQYKGQ